MIEYYFSQTEFRQQPNNFVEKSASMGTLPGALLIYAHVMVPAGEGCDKRYPGHAPPFIF